MPPKKKDKSVASLEAQVAAAEGSGKRKRSRPPKKPDADSDTVKPAPKKAKHSQDSGDIEDIKPSKVAIPSPE
jgi:hypothetical protein